MMSVLKSHPGQLTVAVQRKTSKSFFSLGRKIQHNRHLLVLLGVECIVWVGCPAGTTDSGNSDRCRIQVHDCLVQSLVRFIYLSTSVFILIQHRLANAARRCWTLGYH
eukprot:scaffold284020_cov37-Prasinocladus_malaysianus.AAC.1